LLLCLQTKLQQGILDISIKTGFTDSINFNSQIIDNTAFAKQLIFDDLIDKPLNINIDIFQLFNQLINLLYTKAFTLVLLFKVIN
jgi:hypothetical protein